MPCVRLDSLSISDMARLAGRPHAYPTLPPEPHRSIRCGGALPEGNALYCSAVCARKAGPGAGRYREGLQTGVAHSYAPPKVR
jgi:hypothetical protein